MTMETRLDQESSTNTTGEPIPNRVRKPGSWGDCLFFALLIGIVGICIAGWIYKEWRQLSHIQVRHAEAKTNLVAIFTAQYAYFGQHKTYAGGVRCFENIGWTTESSTKYNYYCGDEVMTCTLPDCDRCLSTKLPGGGPNRQGVALRPIEPKENADFIPSPARISDGARSSRNGFTVFAVGNIDDDGNCDIWSITENKELKNDFNDLKE